MLLPATPAQWILGIILILSSIGVISLRKPIYAALSFLLTLASLAALYLQLFASFISVMQVLVYAGAILVIFVFVIVLFQDAHDQIAHYRSQIKPFLLIFAGSLFILAWFFLGYFFVDLEQANPHLPSDYGTVQSLGRLLYLDFFFPFEAVALLFLVAVVGALYVAKKENQS